MESPGRQYGKDECYIQGLDGPMLEEMELSDSEKLEEFSDDSSFSIMVSVSEELSESSDDNSDTFSLEFNRIFC